MPASLDIDQVKRGIMRRLAEVHDPTRSRYLALRTAVVLSGASKAAAWAFGVKAEAIPAPKKPVMARRVAELVKVEATFVWESGQQSAAV